MACDQPVIEETGVAKILWMTVKSFFRAPVPALKGLIGLTDIVYTISGELDWNITPAMAENNVGLEFQEIYDRDAIESYTDFSRTGIFRYLFWHIGTINLAVIFSLLCKCHKAEFIKLYFRMMLPNLPYYVEAYLLLTAGFWHIEPIGWLGLDGVSKNEMGIYGIDYLKEWFHLDGKGKLTSAVTSMQRWPVTNVGLLVWLVFFYVMLSFMQKQPWKALAALPLVGCWLTIMIATPVCAQFRYVYYYHLMLPVICILLFIKRKEETGEACKLPGIPEECDSKEVPGE